MRPILVDADAFKIIYDELVCGVKNIGIRVLEAVFERDYIAVDDRERIITQWRNCSCGQDDDFFRQWISNRLIEDKIRKNKPASDAQLKKRLVVELGVPRDDLIYLLVAIPVEAYMIISQDIDLYEPRAKQWSSTKKIEIKNGRSGCVCKYMEKHHRVLICLIESACDYLSIDIPS